MRDQQNISIQFNLSNLAGIRSNLYTLVSAIYADPNSAKFKMLYDEIFQEHVLSTLQSYALKTVSESTCLEDAAKKTFFLLKNNKKNITDEYVNTFGHTLSKQTAPYELEHLKNEDIFFRTQCLADLNGFYRAFGLEIDQKERTDHISVQAEFLAYLFFKEFMAIENNLGNEKIEICRKAQRDFWNQHFFEWTRIFVQNLISHACGTFYSEASKFVKIFFDFENSSFNQKT